MSFLLPGLCLSHHQEPLPVLWTRPGARPPDELGNRAGKEKGTGEFFLVSHSDSAAPLHTPELPPSYPKSIYYPAECQP